MFFELDYGEEPYPYPTECNEDSDYDVFSDQPINWRKLFDEEILCDVSIEVEGVSIKAHKALLMYRCQYFAAMFSGRTGNEVRIIYLDGFTFECVHYALCHMYSGIYKFPPTIDIFELADLADMLCFEGLKEHVVNVLEIDYFHEFHDPCKDCLLMIPKFMRWSGIIGYIELYYKMLDWITVNGEVVWAARDIASLPFGDIENCFLHQSLNIGTDTVLATVKRCGKLMLAIPKVSWTTNVFRLSLLLIRKCVIFMSNHLAEILTNEEFLELDSEDEQIVQRVKDHLMAAIERATPGQICAAYGALFRVMKISRELKYANLLNMLVIHCEGMLISCAADAMLTPSWDLLDVDSQARISYYSGAIFVKPPAKPPQPMNKFTRERNIERIRYISYSKLGDINRMPPNMFRHIPNTAKTVKQSFIAPGNSMVTSTKFSNSKNVRCSSQPIIPGSHNAAYKDVKPRYLNPKAIKNNQENIPAKPEPVKKNVPLNRKNVNKSKRGNDFKEINGAKKTSLGGSVEPIKNHLPSKLPIRKNCDSTLGSLTKSVPSVKENAASSYISPYRYRGFVKSAEYKECLSQSNLDKPHEKSFKSSLEQIKGSNQSSPLKKNLLKETLQNSKDQKSPALSVKSPAPSIKSPIPRKHSNDNSSSHSSPLGSQAFQKFQYSNYKAQKGSPKNQKSGVKLAKKSIFEPGQRYSPTSPYKTNKIVPEINVKSKSSPVVVLSNGISNEAKIDFAALERSRTFIKSEPSIISKEITMDSSIEMYPQ